ncbi:hypothetical protein D3C86_1451300 [compost metagenome]
MLVVVVAGVALSGCTVPRWQPFAGPLDETSTIDIVNVGGGHLSARTYAGAEFCSDIEYGEAVGSPGNVAGLLATGGAARFVVQKNKLFTANMAYVQMTSVCSMTISFVPKDDRYEVRAQQQYEANRCSLNLVSSTGEKPVFVSRENRSPIIIGKREFCKPLLSYERTRLGLP